MNADLASIGYFFEPSKFWPGLGYSRLEVLISDRPKQRLFDVKALRIPTFDGQYYHLTQITRHGLLTGEITRVCLGEIILESHAGNQLRVFSCGGNLKTTIESEDLYCEFTSGAPIFKPQEGPKSVSGVTADEIMSMLAEIKTNLPGHEDELYSRLSKYESYPLFLACLVSLQRRVESIPINRRREGYYRVASNLQRAIGIVREVDGWDGRSPSLEDLMSDGGAR